MGNYRSSAVDTIEVDTVTKPRRLKLPAGTYLTPIAECEEAVIYSTKPSSTPKKATYFREVETKLAQQQGRFVVKPKAVMGRLLVAKSASHEDKHVYFVKKPVRPS
jgi:hypothetical protein